MDCRAFQGELLKGISGHSRHILQNGLKYRFSGFPQGRNKSFILIEAK
jgi:hypothetical protein